MKKLKAAVIGLGMGHYHIEQYQKHPDVDLVAIVDTDEAQLERRGEEYGATMFTKPWRRWQ